MAFVSGSWGLRSVVGVVLLVLCAGTATGQDLPQKYRVTLQYDLNVRGNLKSQACDGKCYEGHDCTTCVGVRLFNKHGQPLRTKVYDKVHCCDPCGQTDNKYSPCGVDRCPANHCPTTSRGFSISLRDIWEACVWEDERFLVPPLQAVLGTLHNDIPWCGSLCNSGNFFQIFDQSEREDAFFGGFWTTCPYPDDPHVKCEPADCEAWNGIPGPPRTLSPVGYVRTRNPTYTWMARQDHVTYYRLVVADADEVVLDEMVQPECNLEYCAVTPTRLLESGAHTWTVQGYTPTAEGTPSTATRFEVAEDVPETTCHEMGGNHCSRTGGCPDGFTSFGLTADCNPCCFAGAETQCEALGGQCATAEACPFGFESLGPTYSCANCCRELPTCGAMGGDFCSLTGFCNQGQTDLGPSLECFACCQDPIQVCQSTGCPAGSCGWQTDNCGESIFCGECGPSCGEMGGDYCSQTGGCPSGYSSLGSTYDCGPCCQSLDSCGEMGGDHCSQAVGCPAGFSPLGPSFDCTTCCEAIPCQSTGCPAGSCGWQTDNCGKSIYCGQCAPTCGTMGGDHCSQNTSCPSGYTNLGQSSDCTRCCKSPPSCGAMGGNYCSQTGSCPAGYTSLGRSNDCSPCCVSN